MIELDYSKINKEISKAAHKLVLDVNNTVDVYLSFDAKVIYIVDYDGLFFDDRSFELNDLIQEVIKDGDADLLLSVRKSLLDGVKKIDKSDSWIALDVKVSDG